MPSGSLLCPQLLSKHLNRYFITTDEYMKTCVLHSLFNILSSTRNGNLLKLMPNLAAWSLKPNENIWYGWNGNSTWDPVFVCVCLVTQLCLTLCDPMDCRPPGSSVHGDSPGKKARVGCHAFLQWIFPTQGSNPGLPHCRGILYRLSHQGSPRSSLDIIIQLCVLHCSVVSDSLWPFALSLTGSSVHGLFQARILEWVAISSSQGPKDPSWPKDLTHVSYVSWITGGFFTTELSEKPF